MTSVLANTARIPSPGYDVFPEPGPFDAPPEEPVVPDPSQLPWELRED